MRYWQYLPEILVLLTLEELHQSIISLLKAAWTVLVRTTKLNPPLVYHVGNSTQVNDGWIQKWYFNRTVQLLSDHT